MIQKGLPNCCTNCMEFDNCKGVTAKECDSESKKRLKNASKYAWGRIS